MRSRLSVVAFVLVGALVHFGLLYQVIVEGLTCGIQPHCVNRLSEIGGYLLTFPLNLVAWVFRFDPVMLGVNFYILMFLNSLVAVTLIWFVLIRPFFRRNKLTCKGDCKGDGGS
jgi:hypothetical protein